MRIFFSIAVSMVHAVHDGIRPGIQEAGALCNERAGIKEPFPPLAHGKHFMGSIAMKEKGLEEQRKKPMANKKYNNRHAFLPGSLKDIRKIPDDGFTILQQDAKKNMS